MMLFSKCRVHYRGQGTSTVAARIDDDAVIVRVDDVESPEFWFKMVIPLEELLNASFGIMGERVLDTLRDELREMIALRQEPSDN
jgi:hypothetical protein